MLSLDQSHQLRPDLAVVVPLGCYQRRQHVDLTGPGLQVLGLETGATGLRPGVGQILHQLLDAAFKVGEQGARIAPAVPSDDVGGVRGVITRGIIDGAMGGSIGDPVLGHVHQRSTVIPLPARPLSPHARRLALSGVMVRAAAISSYVSQRDAPSTMSIIPTAIGDTTSGTIGVTTGGLTHGNGAAEIVNRSLPAGATFSAQAC